MGLISGDYCNEKVSSDQIKNESFYEMISEIASKIEQNLKLRIRQSAFNEKVAQDQMKNKSFYQTF